MVHVLAPFAPLFSRLQEGGCVEVKSRRVYVRDFDVLRQNAGE
jgi:hypothetical protein